MFFENTAARNYLLRDTIEYDSVVSWISKKSSIDGDLQLVGLMVQRGDYSNALNELSKIDATHTMSVEQQVEFNAIEEVIETVVDAYLDGRSEGQLDTSEINTLYGIAIDTLVHRPRVYAQNILEVYYGYTFNDPIALSKAPSLDDVLQNDVNKKYKSYFFPNPSKGLLYFDARHNFEGKRFNVYSISGQLVKQGIVESSYLDMRGLPRGLYVIKVLTESNDIVEKIYID